MHILIALDECGFVFSRTASDEDFRYFADKKTRFGDSTVFVEFSGRSEDVHPDLVGLACLLTSEPFAASEITLSQPVSSHFSEVFQTHFQKSIGPVDPAIVPRKMPDSGREGVAFSGGVDSCAALSLLPGNSVPFFMKRVTDERRPTLYKHDAAIASCKALAEHGYDVQICKSDLEYGRDPVGFPVDWSNSTPAVLNADRFALRSIAFGTVLESTYRIGSNEFSNLKSRHIYRAWAAVFDAVGLPICLPVAGLSEVLTSKLALMPKVQAWAPQSCVKGMPGDPCGRCFKCFRKTILTNAISGRPAPDQHYNLFATSREVKKKMLAEPIHHEIVLAYSLHVSGEAAHPVNKALRLKTAPAWESGIEYLGRYYAPALEYVPPHLRGHVSTEIERHFKPMSEQDMQRMRAWNVSSLLADQRYTKGQERLERLAARNRLSIRYMSERISKLYNRCTANRG